ncbi:MAG TPA: hypothetical protein VHS05_21000 [Pyrinomonadaceae bacterium]|jgi:hypothetical protein|nr:hypothetical protein [Pyrinomonadaceae bacterium]
MFDTHRIISKLVLVAVSFAVGLVIPATMMSAVTEYADAVEGEKLVAFLNSSSELRKSFNCRFTGEFLPIPRRLQADLRQAFPAYRFYIAKMEVYIDPPPKEYDLIVLADAKTEEIAAYVWGSYWTLPPSASFEHILQGQQAKSKEEALNQVKLLAELIVHTNNDKVGKAITEKRKLKVELLRGDGVFRILEIKIDKELRLGRLSITGIDGKKPRYFV